jgi:type I restriction enzyme S subunit
MNPGLLVKQFDTISDAPDAIPRLRRFVLDLAVRGKLVEQDPTNEPASALIKRVQLRKAEIANEGAVRKEKPFPPLAENALPFRIPPTWKWSQIAEIGFLNPRNTAEDDIQASFVPMPRISAEYGVSNTHEVRPWGEIKSGFTHFAEGDVGLAKITPCFENGKSTIFRGLTGGTGAGTTELHVVRPVIVSAEYVLIFLKCPHFVESGIPKMTGTAGQKRVPTEYFAFSPFPLPPLAEQQRIVAKVDELMALCDRFEAAKIEREIRRDRLAAASHHHLYNGANAEAFRKHARFYLNHFPRLSTSALHIERLRQTVLDLAVRGQLVGQDPNDDSVSELLKRVLVKRERLRNGGKSNTKESLSSIHPPNEPFAIPIQWRWIRLGTLVHSMKNGIYKPSGFYSETGTICVRMYNIQNGRLDLSKLQHLELTQHEIEQYRLEAKDILVNRVNSRELVGKAAILDESREPLVFEAMNIRLRLVEKENLADYVNIVLQTNRIRVEFQGYAKQAIGQASVSQPQVANIMVPLPPLAEQRRIVAKVDELMTICDRLESHLTTTQAESRRLLEAVLHQSLAEAS